MSLKRLSILVTSVAAAGLLAVGCGDSEDEVTLTDSGLATYAPANPPLYIEGAIRPEGSLKSDLEELAGRFPQGERAGEMIIESINEDLSEEGLTYERDIEPWLGNRGAVFVPDSRTEATVGAVEVTDEAAAEETLRERITGQATETEVGDVTVVSGRHSEGEQVAFAVTENVALIGNDSETVADAAGRGEGATETFASNSEYSRFVGEAGESLLLGGRADVSALLTLAETSGEATPAELESFRGIAGELAAEPVLFAVTAESDRAAIEVSAAAGEDAAAGSGEESELLSSIPQEAWAALAVPAVGDSVESLVQEISRSGGESQGQFEAFQRQLRSQFGIDVSDFGSLGDAAVFAAGTSILELEIGAIFEVTDEAQARQLLDGARTALTRQPGVSVSDTSIPQAEGFTLQPEGVPVPVNFVIAGNRLVIAAGDQVTQELISGEGGFDESEARNAAADALGDGFALNAMLDFDPIVQLVESTGQGGGEFEQARPYLDPLDFLTVGTSSEGERDVTRIVVTTSD